MAAKHESGPFECLTIVNAMHKRCVEDAERGMVEQVFRKTGFIAHDFDETGMTEASGERWENLPLGGVNLPKKYMDLRFGHTDELGVPMKPDWKRVHELRAQERASAKDTEEIKQKGYANWQKAKASERVQQLEKAATEREKKEDRIMDEERQTMWTNKDRCRLPYYRNRNRDKTIGISQ